jgi:hypothetical protein
MCSELPTATFLNLSNWENKSINAYRARWCKITQNTAPRLASSPRQNSRMQCQPRGRVYNVISPANHTWSMDIIAVWYKEAQQRLTDASPNWL